jgi:hypothetical protein
MDEATAKAARAEFHTFVRWFNKNVGLHPIIIGGWAVDYYNDYFGSKDIDVIFEGTKDVYERRLLQFLDANGYRPERTDAYTETFKKRLSVGGKNVEIDIDAADTATVNQFHADLSISIPYSLCSKHSLELSSDKMIYRIPRLELLLAYKIKAYHDRDFEVSQPETARQGLVGYYASKRDKDGSDIIALLDSRQFRHDAIFDDGFMGNLVRDHGFKAQAREVFDNIQDRPGSRHLYSRIEDKARLILLSDFSGRIFK